MSELQHNTKLTRAAELASFDREELNRLLDSVHIGHFALIADEQPVVLPTAVIRDGDQVLIHGSTGSPWLHLLAAGAQTSLAVTAFDGLVLARSAFESSMHYRSAVLFGRCTTITKEDKRRALDVITEALLPGRAAEVREPTAKEFAATLVLALPIERWSLKVSAGWPEDPASDVAGEAWAGVIPAWISYGAPRAAPDLRDGIAIPASLRRLRN
jgi:hypothetical protein